jgi:hypothetical protein
MHFIGSYEYRYLAGGIGRNLPQEDPHAFAHVVVDANKSQVTLDSDRQESLRPKSIPGANMSEHPMNRIAGPLVAVAAVAGDVANHQTHGAENESDRSVRTDQGV